MATRSTRTRISRSRLAGERQNLVPGPQRSRVVGRGAFCQVYFPEASRCLRLNLEFGRPGKLRPANPVRTCRQFKCQFDAFSRGDAYLGQHVRRVGRSTDAIRFQVHLANLRMDSKDQLDRAGEIERVVEVAGRAMPVIADCPERVLDLARDPADGAEQVPEQDKQPFARAMKTGRDELIRVKAKPLGQRQGSDPGDFRIRSLAQEFAQPIGHARFDVALEPAGRALARGGTVATSASRAGSSKGSAVGEVASLPVMTASIR